MRRSLVILAIALCLVVPAMSAYSGQSWSFASDYSISNGNPNGPWAYGYGDPSSGLFTVYDTAGSVPSGFEYWATGDGSLGGVVLANPTDAGILSNGAYVDAGVATMHPGQTFPCIVRWTAPVAMLVRVEGAFMEVGGGDCDAHVYRDGVALADGAINGFYGTPPDYTDRRGSPRWDFSLITQVGQGEVIDFVLGVGADGSYTSGTTALEATITDIGDGDGTISGHVLLDQAGNPPVVGATVEAVGASRSTTTDSNGFYSLELPPGDHTVLVSAADCLAQSRLIHLGLGEARTEDFVLSPDLSGQIWDFAADFSVTNGNPNGVWAYGYRDLSSDQYVHYTISGSAPGGCDYWLAPDEGAGGNALHNPQTFDFWSGSTFLPAGEAFMHPGQTNPSTARWTAPRNAWVSIEGYFRQEAGGDCDTHVVKNGQSLADGVVSGFYGTPPAYADRTGSPEWTFSTIAQVTLGDTIDFVLGIGPDNNWGYGTTALRAIITDITDQVGTVSGHVYLDEAGHPPAEGASVVVVGTSFSTVTDSSGYFWIPLFSGDYTLRVSKQGYVPESLAVHVPPSGNATCEVTLSPVSPVTVTRIGEIRPLPESTPVTISSAKTVTVSSGVFTDGSYYIEDPDRASGIRIAPAAGSAAVLEGDRVALTGTLALTADGERYLKDAQVTSKTSGTAVRPLGLVNRSVRSAIGLQPTGLLVRVWGTVTYRASDGSCIYIDDGSKCSNGAGNPVGLKVVYDGLSVPFSPLPEPGDRVTVTGLVSLSAGVAVIRPRNAADMIVDTSGNLGQDLQDAQEWFASYLAQNAGQIPFSFTYDGISSSTLLAGWAHSAQLANLDSVRTQVTHTYTGPSGEQVRCAGVIYNDYPVVEWTVYIKNTGATDTQIWQNVQAIDVQLARPTPTEFVLHRAIGSPCQPNDFQPIDELMTPGRSVALAAGGGRSTNANLCYFNIESAGSGVIMALGWPGQWAASFTRDSDSNMRVIAGQELTNFRLHPGEEVRTPLVALQFFSNGQINAQNTWRRWMVDHNMPRKNGEVIPAQFGGCWGNLQPNAAEECAAIQGYYDDGVEFSWYDLDAGWYVDYGSWVNTGTWEVDYTRFPNGVRQVSDLLRANGTKFMLWFEPERVAAGTWLAQNHPEWIFGGSGGGLYNMGDSAALSWMIDRCSSLITSEGVDWFRNDYNIDPLGYWRGADASDRQGIAENFYVQGFLKFWDELVRLHPDIWIDTCASGGRRNDLEVLRRSVPVLRSDYAMEALGEQCHTYGISYWMPCNGTGGGLASMYDQRSCYNPLHRIGYNPLDPNRPKAMFLKSYAETMEIMPYWYGDYYPLTPYSLAKDVWMGWQFNSPEQGGGFFQVFRRENSTVSSMQFRLGGLEPQSSYILKNLDDGSTQTVTGASLAGGFTISLPTPRTSAIYTYTKTQ